MTAVELILQVTAMGGQLVPESATRLRYCLPADHPPKLLDELKENAAEVLRMLSPLTETIQ
jgi:hypothetical protein